MELMGLHHVTAITGDVATNVAWYTQTLGMRLVKQTVNQDDTSAYHLFYADRLGSAGTDLTFFDWPASPRNRLGAGTIVRTALRVQGQATLDWWAERLTAQGRDHSGVVEQGGWTVLLFADPEGLPLALVDDGGMPGGEPWEHSPVPPALGIRGLYAVTLQVRDLEPTAAMLTRVMGFRVDRTYTTVSDPPRKVTVFATGAGGPGAEVHVEHGADLAPGQPGRGGVHHVAFRVPTDEEHQAWLLHLRRMSVPTSPIIDRFYFRSIYFQEPNGVLFELATDGPGFATDENPDHLGETLALPPFLEPQRAAIVARLRPIASLVRGPTKDE